MTALSLCNSATCLGSTGEGGCGVIQGVGGSGLWGCSARPGVGIIGGLCISARYSEKSRLLDCMWCWSISGLWDCILEVCGESWSVQASEQMLDMEEQWMLGLWDHSRSASIKNLGAFTDGQLLTSYIG